MPAPDGGELEVLGALPGGYSNRQMRRGAVDLRGHGKEPPDQYLLQAGGQRQGRSDRLGLAARSGGAVCSAGGGESRAPGIQAERIPM